MANVTAPQFQQDVNNAADWANGDENTTVTMRLGQQADSPAKVIKRVDDLAEAQRDSIDALAAAQREDIYEKATPSVKGTFEAGFTFENLFERGKFGTEPSETYWAFTGGSANLPHEVTALTDPGAGGPYEQVALNVASDISVSGGGSVQSYINNNLTPLDTVAEMRAYDYSDNPFNTIIEWGGYYTKGDGGGNKGLLKLGDSTSLIDDGGSIFVIVNDAVNGVWIEADKTSKPKKWGIVGDGIADDTVAWVNMESQLNDFDVVDYSGLIVRFTSNVTTTNELVTHSNGCFLLDTCYFNLDVSNIDFENVRFKGVENLTQSDFTGSFLGGLDVAPAVSNGDAYYNKTENKVYIAKDGSWQKIYKDAGLRAVNSGGSNKDRIKFKSCKFNLLDEAFSCSSDSDSQDLYDFVGKCEFNKNGIGLKLNDPKRVDIGDSRTSDNSCGIELNTDDYEGLGVTMSNAYINGNVFGLRGRGGLYDSTMTGNTFDHNRFLSILGGDISYGTGMELTVPAGRILRQLVFTGNNGRNNGDYSFVFIIEGTMDYCNIGGNAAWLDDQDNILIDYSSGTATNNLLEGNRFLDGYNIIDNGTPWETNNAAFDAFNGGNIRGYLQLGTQLRLIPRTTTAFDTNEGNMTFLDGHASLSNGLYINANVGQDGLGYKRIQTCEWYQTVNRPSGSSMPLNYSYWDSTLVKPVFRGNGGNYYTFNIDMIIV